MSAQTPTDYAFENTNRWSTKELVTMALLCAVSVLLSFIEFPLIPGITWLKFDAAAMPAMVVGFAYGPGAGFVVGLASALVHGALMGDWVGALMNVVVDAALIVPAAIIYQRKRTYKRAIAGLAVSAVCAVVCAILANVVIDPFYFGMPMEAVIALVVPVLLPFNIAKSVLDAVLTLIVYKAVSNLITPQKDQVRGK